VCEKLAEAIKEAADHMQPARVKIATGQAHGKIAYNAYAEKLYDPRCDVIQFLTGESAPIATLVNYACHPEVIGAARESPRPISSARCTTGSRSRKPASASS